MDIISISPFRFYFPLFYHYFLKREYTNFNNSLTPYESPVLPHLHLPLHFSYMHSNQANTGFPYICMIHTDFLWRHIFMEILRAKNLIKIYGTGNNAVHALDGVDLSINKGEFVAIVGTSGSGSKCV